MSLDWQTQFELKSEMDKIRARLDAVEQALAASKATPKPTVSNAERVAAHRAERAKRVEEAFQRLTAEAKQKGPSVEPDA